ncbi:kinase-like domain-containing protein [Boletus edulis]|nr:kinase-like domain-containing protein [Boletus edulis]
MGWKDVLVAFPGAGTHYPPLSQSEHVRDSISLLVAEPQPEMSRRSTSLSVQFPPPPDLTPHIIRIQNQYSAGGSFGDVYKCRYHGSPVPMEVAVKSFRFNFTTEGDTGNRSIRMLRRELGIWRRLKHDNIVPFLGIAYGFGMDGTMSLVSLWMPNESLHSFLPKYDDNLGAVHRLQFLLDIANGLHYLHSLLIIHGDLNCNNVLLDADYTARLADFGYASLAGNIPDALVYLQRSTVRPGALRWSAPEQIQSEETFDWTTKSDIYSFGCVALQESLLDANVRLVLIFLQVLSGKQPWSEIREDVAVVLRLAKGHQPGRPQSRVMDDSYWDLIQDCWSSKEERPDVEIIIPTIQRFLSCLPRPQPLCDLLPSWSSRADSRMDTPALSLSQAAIEDSRWSVDTIESDPPPSVVEHEDRIAMLSHSLSPRRTSRGISTIPTDSVSLPEAPSHSAGEFLGHTYVDEVDAERPQKRQRRE